jgi:hypothetical protein
VGQGWRARLPRLHDARLSEPLVRVRTEHQRRPERGLVPREVALYALQCLETLVLGNASAMEVRPEAYWRYNRLVDERNSSKAWSDPRARNYYWTEHGRSAVMNPFYSAEMSGFLRKPDLADLEIA